VQVLTEVYKIKEQLQVEVMASDSFQILTSVCNRLLLKAVPIMLHLEELKDLEVLLKMDLRKLIVREWLSQ
jgi:hypothetical protein